MGLTSHTKELSGMLPEIMSHSRFEDTDYLAMIYHEIGTPLTAILGISHILANVECNQKRRSECNDVLRDSSNMLMGLMSNMLDSSKLHTGSMDLEHTVFDLCKVMDEAKNITTVKAAEKGLILNMHIDKPYPTMFLGDPLRIRQILINLLGNAVKFTSTGMISVHMTQGVTQSGYSRICITVADTGIGIEKDQLGKIFGKCAQAHPGIRQSYGGSGLGLFISRQLAHLMNGDINVKSTPGKGSQFTVAIPLQMASKSVANQKNDDSEEFLNLEAA